MSTEETIFSVVIGDKGGCRKTSFAAELADYYAERLKAKPHLFEIDIRHEVHLQKIHPETRVLDLFDHKVPDLALSPSPDVFEQIYPVGAIPPKRIIVDLGGGVGRMFCLWLADGAIHAFTRHSMRFVFFVMVNEGKSSTFEFADKLLTTTKGWAEVVVVKCPRDQSGDGDFSALKGMTNSIVFPTMPAEIMDVCVERNITWSRALEASDVLGVFQWGRVQKRRDRLHEELTKISNLVL